MVLQFLRPYGLEDVRYELVQTTDLKTLWNPVAEGGEGELLAPAENLPGVTLREEETEKGVLVTCEIRLDIRMAFYSLRVAHQSVGGE